MGSIDRDRFLKIFPFFRNASQPLVDNVLSSSRCMKLPDRVLVSLEGDYCQNFFLMLSGEKRIFKIGSSGREITLYEIGPGDICILNASCILSNTCLPANSVTTCETEILILPAQSFLDMTARYEDMRTFIHSHINAGLASLMALVSEIAFGKMDDRLTNYLIEKSENARLRRTHHQIANDLGTSREVVSRMLKEFERQGLISLSRNFIQLQNL